MHRDGSGTHRYLVSGASVEHCILSPAGAHGKKERGQGRRERRGVYMECD